MIELKNVSKWYGDFQVLSDCSTTVKKGEVVVVAGPSGSGKSTLIKTINALESFQQGEIWLKLTQLKQGDSCCHRFRRRDIQSRPSSKTSSKRFVCRHSLPPQTGSLTSRSPSL